MIDVVFNLIVFFLVASHFSHAESEAPISLPVASQAGSNDVDPNRLTITVAATGEWSVAGRPVTLEEIGAMIRDGATANPVNYSVHIRGDRAARYEFIEPLLLASAKNNVTSVRFNVVSP